MASCVILIVSLKSVADSSILFLVQTQNLCFKISNFRQSSLLTNLIEIWLFSQRTEHKIHFQNQSQMSINTGISVNIDFLSSSITTLRLTNTLPGHFLSLNLGYQNTARLLNKLSNQIITILFIFLLNKRLMTFILKRCNSLTHHRSIVRSQIPFPCCKQQGKVN